MKSSATDGDGPSAMQGAASTPSKRMEALEMEVPASTGGRKDLHASLTAGCCAECGDDSGKCPCCNSHAEEELNTRSTSPLRWLILALSLLILLGPYYAYDVPAGTQAALREYYGVPPVANENTTAVQNATIADFNIKYNLLYTVYSIPNTVWPVFAGMLVDWLGAPVSNIAATGTCLGGQALVAGGVGLQLWPLAWAGRAVFGIGTEMMCVSSRMLVANWFLGKELALAMGALLATGRLSSVINDAISGLFPGPQVTYAYHIGTALCASAVLASAVAYVLDKRHEEAHAAKRAGKSSSSSSSSSSSGSGSGSSSGSGKKLPSWRAMFTWPWPFWLLCLLCIVGYNAVVSFNNVASAFLVDRWSSQGRSTDEEHVNSVMAILFLTAAIAASPAGSAVDRLQCRAGFMLTACVFVTAAHAMLAFAPDVPVEFLFGVLGTSFAMFAAALWPAVAYVVPQESLGAAYGLMGAFQNVGLSIVPIAVSELQPPACTGRFTCVELLFGGIGLLGITLCAVMYIQEAGQAAATGAPASACAPVSILRLCGFLRRRQGAGAAAGGDADCGCDDGDGDEGEDDDEEEAALMSWATPKHSTTVRATNSSINNSSSSSNSSSGGVPVRSIRVS